MTQPVLVIGVGNRTRRDDGVGLWLVREIMAQRPADVESLETGGEGTALMEAWKGRQTVFLFDAIRSGAPYGTIRRMEAKKSPLPKNLFRCSTHDFGVAEAVELSRSLGQLPGRLVIIGVEGKDFGEGEGLSPEVEAAARSLVNSCTYPTGIWGLLPAV